MRKERRKFSITLLEVVLALSLTSILLFFLFGFFHQISLLDVHTQAAQERLSARNRIQMRLMQVFSTLTEEEESSFFYTQNQSLIFSFNNGVDIDADLCGPVKAELCLSGKKKALELHISPIEGHHEVKREVFMEDLQTLSFNFFDPKTKTWKDVWDNQSPLPPMLKITIKREGEEKIDFAFFLSPSQMPITYPS